MKPEVRMKAVDLFCGAGGLTHGLESAGVHVVEGVDIDPACKYPYEENNQSKYVLKSVRDYTAEDLQAAWGDAEIRVLVGCAPCQPFSTYSQGGRGGHRVKWVLLNRFSELVTETEPDLVSMENVTLLSKTPTFKRFVNKLKKIGYFVSYQIVDCREYGAAQTRRRLVLLASRLGEIKIEPPTHTDPESWGTVRDVIGGQPSQAAGTVDVNDRLHRSSRLTDINLRRIKASKPGGTWRDWPQDLVASCHKKKSGKTYPGVYGRMVWDEPAPTMTGQCFGFGNGRFGHPEQDRAITLREAALLQTFPRSYKFVPDTEPIHMKTVGRMIGNAVPPILGQIIGETFRTHVSNLSR